MKVFFGLPTHSGTRTDGAALAIVNHGLQEGGMFIKPFACSLLAHGFNRLWCQALHEKYDYFFMLHADVEPCEGWAAILLEELQANDADVVSAVVRIKDNHGIVSTGIGIPGDPYRLLKRFTLKELKQLPKTFTAEDAGHPGYPLLVNTGCWVADLSKPWCRATDASNRLKTFFTINDEIVYDSEQDIYKILVEPEDWHFSRRLYEAGAKVMATKAVSCEHTGPKQWSTDEDCGDEVDKASHRYRKTLSAEQKQSWTRAFARSCP